MYKSKNYRFFRILQSILDDEAVVVIGEINLDYLHTRKSLNISVPRDRQSAMLHLMLTTVHRDIPLSHVPLVLNAKGLFLRSTHTLTALWSYRSLMSLRINWFISTASMPALMLVGCGSRLSLTVGLASPTKLFFQEDPNRTSLASSAIFMWVTFWSKPMLPILKRERPSPWLLSSLLQCACGLQPLGLVPWCHSPQCFVHSFTVPLI